MAKAVIYCRVSTKDQVDNLSLPTQEKQCREYCNRNSIEVVRVFVEEGESAKTADRTELNKLLGFCRKNQSEVDHLIIYALNRLARNQYDHMVLRALFHANGITLRSVTEPIDESATGKLMEGVLAAISQFDNDIRADRTKAGMKAAIEEGRWVFQPPIGYVNGRDRLGRKNLEPDPVNGPLVRKAFELQSSGLQTQEQTKLQVKKLGLTPKSGRSLSTQTFNKMIRNPVYAGWIVVEGWGEPRKGAFDPLVSQEVFDKTQAILDGKAISVTPHLKNHPDFPLRRFVYCGACKTALTGSWSKGRNQRYPYYKCRNKSCKAVSIRSEKMEEEFIKVLKAFGLRRDYYPLFREIILDRWKMKQTDVEEVKHSLTIKIEQLKMKKQRLFDAFVYEKAISREVYDEQEAKLKEEIVLHEMDLHQMNLEELDIEGVLNFAEYLLLNLSRLWTELSLDQKQRLQKVIFPKGIGFLNGEFETAVTSPVFSMLEEIPAVKSNLVAPTGFEPVLPA